MTGPQIPKGAEGADPGEELAESPAGETSAGSALSAASPPADAGAAVDDDAGGPITPIFSNEPLRGAPPEPPAPARAPSVGTATGLPELTVLTRALGVLALCGWSVGVVIGVLLIKGNTEQFLLSNFFGNTGRMFLLGVMAAGAGLAGLAGLIYYQRTRAREGAEGIYRIAKRVSPIAKLMTVGPGNVTRTYWLSASHVREPPAFLTSCPSPGSSAATR